MVDGGGRLNALDWRNPQANGTGQLGGLFQAANYIAGLSGGAWLVGGLAMNGNPKIFDQWHKVWNLGESVINPGGIDILQTGSYYTDILSEVHEKQIAGFAVTITDVWGRALSRHLIDSTIYGDQGGPGATWTDIARQQAFINHTMPFPIVIADQRSPGASAIATNTSNYEFNAFEFGSFDASVFAFTPMKYLGSNLQNVHPLYWPHLPRFSGAMTVLNNTVATSDLLTYVLSELSNDQFDIASYPNPFFGIPGIQGSEASDLTLVDGGMDGQNIALNPLLQAIRQLDVIIASDSSADTDNHWPNGTALVTAYDRYTSEQGNGTSFVYVPDAQTFVNLGLNTRPTFFGCNRSNITAGINVAPLIVYLPNAPISSFSNFSTFLLEYSEAQVAAILENGWNVATRGNGTLDSQWPTCLACAITQRSREAAGLPLPAECESCFSRYCWNGTLDTTPRQYDPSLQITATIIRRSCGFFDRFFRRSKC